MKRNLVLMRNVHTVVTRFTAQCSGFSSAGRRDGYSRGDASNGDAGGLPP